MKKLKICALACGIVLALVSCKNGTTTTKDFSEAPVLTLEKSSADSIAFRYTHTEPRADRYDLYWAKGDKSRNEIMDSNVIQDSPREGKITELAAGDIISALVVAVKKGYNSESSGVVQVMVTDSGEPGAPEEFITAPVLTLQNTASGLAYSFIHAEPRPDRYDLYWVTGDKSGNEVMEGTVIGNAIREGKIDGPAPGDIISALVVAVKAGYNSKASNVAKITVTNDSSGDPTVPSVSLSLEAAGGSIRAHWTAANLTATSYDLYYAPGNVTDQAALKEGTKVAGATSPHTISGLTNGTQYSVMAAANTAEGEVLSPIRRATPVASSQLFESGPTLNLTELIDGVRCEWEPSVPAATSYDIYWVYGTVNDPEVIKATGTKITNPASGRQIRFTGEASIMITANRAGYASADSEIVHVAIVLKDFITAPVLQLAPVGGGVICNWTDSDPAADSYDIYWVTGNVTNPAAIKAGTKITNPANGRQIALTGEASILVTANKAGYNSADSAIGHATPLFGAAPGLTLTPSGGSIITNWTASNPAATSYTVYWMAGAIGDAGQLKANGTNIANITERTHTITGLTNGEIYSVMVTAIRAGYEPANSVIRTAVPAVNPFTTAPFLSLIPADEALYAYWSASDPAATTYDICYVAQDTNNPVTIKGGTKITGVTPGVKITGLSNGTTYSAIVTANRTGFTSTDSTPRKAAPTNEKSQKRGVGYGFERSTVAQAGNEMDLLMNKGVNGGANGIKWFYSWGINPNATVVTQANGKGLLFCPMTWNNNWNESNVRTIKQQMPNIEYILAYNEPNFRFQSNMTPAQAAAAWPRLKAIANELGLKIISPAMNYSGGYESMGWDNPIAWLDSFFSQPGVSLDDIDGIAVHMYAWWANVAPMNDYRKYGKPLWLTEFCGWEDVQDWRQESYDLQAWYLSMAVPYLEKDPLVARYAWYIPKGHVAQNAPPYHNLLTDGNNPQLTDLGKIYTNITTLDKSVWVPSGQKIDAAQYTDARFPTTFSTTPVSWTDIILTKPTTDTDQSAGILELRNYSPNSATNMWRVGSTWVEYQVDLASSKNYSLALRLRSEGNTSFVVAVDGVQAGTRNNFNSAAYTELSIDIGAQSAGNHTIRLTMTTGTGNYAINWIRLD